VSPFDRLHPTIQHHVVNTMGWRELRPLQMASIEPVVDGCHTLLIAPTAGGKTEAAFLPLLTRMVTEDWRGLGIIYVCPLKALLNNLHVRLERYCQWVGRTCAIWHGDVLEGQRKAILRELPDCLLTTPESLEAMLVSSRIDHRAVFASVRAIVVDEIHAFAGDDRGWHLLSVLERVTRLSGREIQRVGLSATVGNPEALLDWLAGHCEGRRQLVQIPISTTAPTPEVTVDYVGSLENAASVIAALYRGEKRLVFCDSRSRVEQLAILLRSAGVETHVSHSSLSADERRRAEQAFSEATNCVIVATSTLELGIDVGDLDRVIQIDAPTTVASFLQRLGRTGRRADSKRNCLFLATTEDALIQATALVSLWGKGFVEPIIPPDWPIHLLGQQILALVLQERSLPAGAWEQWLLRLPVFAEIAREDRDALVNHLIEAAFIHVDQGQWMLGGTAEDKFGYKHFSELVSVFTSPPVFEVWHGQTHVGTVEQSVFMGSPEQRRTLSLGGRAWRVVEISWSQRRALVQPELGEARTRWLGGERSLGFELCQEIRRILANDEVPDFLSRRGIDSLGRSRDEFLWLRNSSDGVKAGNEEATEWWTFAGRAVNRWICDVAAAASLACCTCDDLRVTVRAGREKIATIRQALAVTPEPELDTKRQLSPKFSELLPATIRSRFVRCRAYDSRKIRRFSTQLDPGDIQKQ
jgi:ATP-dependent Lhr-like helicase